MKRCLVVAAMLSVTSCNNVDGGEISERQMDEIKTIINESNRTDHYLCRVVSAKFLQNDGSLSDDGVFKILIGRVFAVNKSSGEILGNFIKNSNSNGNPSVIDKGSKDQSFKVVTIYRPFVSLDYLQINQYAETIDKPFVLYSQNSIFAGTCRS